MRRGGHIVRGIRAAWASRGETPAARAERRREQARNAWLDARDILRAILEDQIEEATRVLCPDATDVDVEVYSDELGEPRGRLITVNTAAGGTAPDDVEDAVRDRLVDLLDEWATTANVDCTNICFRQLPTPPPPAATATR